MIYFGNSPSSEALKRQAEAEERKAKAAEELVKLKKEELRNKGLELNEEALKPKVTELCKKLLKDKSYEVKKEEAELIEPTLAKKYLKASVRENIKPDYEPIYEILIKEKLLPVFEIFRMFNCHKVFHEAILEVFINHCNTPQGKFYKSVNASTKQFLNRGTAKFERDGIQRKEECIWLEDK
jgi:hypothetical protein